MATIPISITAPAAGATVGAAPTVTWTLPAGVTRCKFQIGAYRTGDRTSGAPLTQAAPPPFDYHPVAASGYPNLAYGVTPDPVLIEGPPSFTFSGGNLSTGALPNGSYIIWLHVVVETLNDNNEVTQVDNGVATVSVTVAGSTIQEPRRIPRDENTPPGPPTILAPTEGQALTSGAVAVQVQVPPGISPSEFKAAVYRFEDFYGDVRNPVVFTDRDEPGRGTTGGAEWVPATEFPLQLVSGRATWTLTFGASSVLPTEIPNSPTGGWVMAVRYNWEETARILSFNPRTGFTRVKHRFRASQAAIRHFDVSGSTDDYDIPDLYEYTPTARPSVTWPRRRTRGDQSLPFDLRWQYHNRRGVAQRSVNVRRRLTGGTNAGTRYLARSTAGVFSWVTALATDGTTDIALRSELLQLQPNAAVGTGWGRVPWGTHNFAVRPTSQAGVLGDWSDDLQVDVYRKLTITSINATVVGGYIQVRWAHDGSSGNNRQARYRIQVFDSTTNAFVTGTSDRPATPDHARAVPGDLTSFTFNRTQQYSLGPVRNGTYRVVLTLWGAYGDESEQNSDSVTVNNTAPTAPAITPRVYDHNDQVQPGTTGLIPGEYVGIAFGAVTGLHAVRLERRDFSRTDGRELQDDPQQVALLPLGEATSLDRFNDYLVDDGTEYEYRPVAIAPTGAETEGGWVP